MLLIKGGWVGGVAEPDPSSNRAMQQAKTSCFAKGIAAATRRTMLLQGCAVCVPNAIGVNQKKGAAMLKASRQWQWLTTWLMHGNKQGDWKP